MKCLVANENLKCKFPESEQRNMLEARELQEELVKLEIKCKRYEQEKVELHNRVKGKL